MYKAIFIKFAFLFLFLNSKFKFTNSKLIKKLPKGFVYLSDIDPTIQQSIRYASDYNFIGRPLVGYKKDVCILTLKAALALSKVQKELKKYNKKYSLKVYDAYRPQKAVKDICLWSKNLKDTKMQLIFYPKIKNKNNLFIKGYIAKQSSHSRGSTVDVTIINTESESLINKNTYNDNSIDMGTIFDFFDQRSNYNNTNISKRAKINRKLLRHLMIKYGFRPYEKEWWHFTLVNEPFPKTYYNFSIK